jgi:predicted RNA-binding protein YlqC (UPF0109 family)
MSDAAPQPADLIEFIAKGIVSQPDKIRVHVRDGGALLELETAPEDRGRVIGRQGRIAKALRALLDASHGGGKVQLEIID